MTAEALPGPARYSIYTGRVTNWWLVVASALAVLALVVNGRAPGSDWTGLVLPLVLACIGIIGEAVTGSSVRTTAGPQGVTVHFGALGWPRCTYALSEITRAEVVVLRFWSVTGGLWWTPRRTYCTLRTGPTLKLTIRNGRTVTVSVPDPGAAVAALEDARVASPPAR
jgi:hypothetical protein